MFNSKCPQSIYLVNYFEYQYCQTLNMLSSIMKSMKYVNVLSMSYSIRRNFHRTSKFSSNLIVYLLFLFFAVSKKKKESLWNIFFLITKPFLYLEGLEGALKLISQEQFKNTTTKIFQVRQKFRGSTKISTHRIWHGEHIKAKLFLETM